MSGFRPLSRDLTIANGATTSPALRVPTETMLGLITPAALTGTSLSFLVSMDNGTFVPLNDSGTNAAVSVTITPGRAYAFDPILFLGWSYIKFVSNATELADRIFTLSVRPVA
jgi:hypothetical protein